ncbi:MAG TPA: alpha/beta fold hydrolase [Edaphobacter sp.]|nr:alpha/beta fold hydrolase [Edaphobacter sp.]
MFLSTKLWGKHCKQAGFDRLEWLPEDGSETAILGEHIFLATLSSPAASTSLPDWIKATGGVLGHLVANANTYVADWSDCVGRPNRLTERIQLACSELSCRHGNGKAQFRIGWIEANPASLSEVRLRWIAGAFGRGHVDIATRNRDGGWSSVARGEALSSAGASALPAPHPAPQTHYRWQWEPVEKRDGSTAAVSLAGSSEELIARLSAAGVEISDHASSQLLVMPDADPLELAQHVFDALADKQHRPLIAVTRGAWAHSSSKRVLPSHSAVWGLLRVAASEDPSRSISIIDLEKDADWGDLRIGLAALKTGSHRLAVRAGVTYRQILAAVKEEASPLPPGSFSGQGWHAVTGGFGGLGRVSTLWLAQQGARKIAILAPRSHPDQETFFGTLRKEFGCELRWLLCDTGNPEQLRESLQSLDIDGGVNGVIHAAGVLDDAPHTAFDAERLRPVFAVKAAAAGILQDWLAHHGGQYLLLYSSAAAALGAPGQSAHAFSCGYLDGLAHHTISGDRPRHSLTTISIAWGAWGEIGRAANPALKERLALSGMSTLSTAEGLWHLEQAVMLGAPYRLAMRAEKAITRDDAPLPPEPEGPLSIPSREQRSSTAVSSASKAKEIEQLTHEGVAEWLCIQITEQLRLDDASQLTPQQDLLQLGLDSLLFLELSSAIQNRFGVRIEGDQAYQDMTVSGLAGQLLEMVSRDSSSPKPSLAVHDASHRFDPFPLTPIQHAYWLGRTDLLDYGGVACHVLFEWDISHNQFDLNRLERAWNALIKRHDMLRMVISDDGMQHILERVPEYRFIQVDLHHLSPSDSDARLEQIRHDLSYKVPRTDQWPMFEIMVSILAADRYRLHMDLDLLQFDTQSFKIMMDDLEASYSGKALKPLAFTFRDYVQKELTERESEHWRKSWVYWQDLLPELPPAPVLPLAGESLVGQPHFSTYQDRISASAWTQLKREWKQWGVTPSSALLSLFAMVLERWSRHPSFTLNLTFFSRKAYHSDVPEIIGDFTSVLLVDFESSHGKSLKEQIEQTQERLWERLAHSDVNGVELLRDFRRKSGFDSLPAMPVVFTSMLGMTMDGKAINQALGSFLGDPMYMFTQTPQVWLDHQIMEVENELIFNWFSMDGVLRDGVAAAMFADYAKLLHDIAARPECTSERIFWSAWQSTSALNNSYLESIQGQIIDVRYLENALRSHPAVRHVQIDVENDGTEAALVATVVARDRNKRSEMPSQRGIDNASLPLLPAQELAELENTWQYLEAQALHGICQTLLRHGVFGEKDRIWELEEISSVLQVAPQYRRLLQQWLKMLCKRGLLQAEGSRFECLQPLTAVHEPITSAPTSMWDSLLLQYLEGSTTQHDALLRGAISPLELLFGQNHFTDALYSANPVMRCLNSAASEIARQLARNSNHFKVLEVGGGTAATTRHLLPVLAERLSSYHFTDVSTLFLDGAQSEFAGYPQLRCGLFDINTPVDFAHHPAGGYNLVVAVNVLHDATHIVHALHRLGRLLSPEGRLMIIEATERESIFQLATVGFIEGLSGFEDFRIFDNNAMLDIPMWRDALERAAFDTELVWPPDVSSPMRQHLILAHPRTEARLKSGEIEAHLRSRYATLPFEIRLKQCEVLSGQKNVRRRASQKGPQPSSISAQDDVHIQDQQKLEETAISIWQSLLPRQRIDRNSDFFQAGGDSLIATRMVAALARHGFSRASLQNLFANTILSDFCRTLAASTAPEDSDLLLLSKGQKKNSLYLFHASDGDLGSYHSLVIHLESQVYGLRAGQTVRATTLRELVQRYVQAIRKHHSAGEPYALAGWSYGAFLAAEAARQLVDLGEPVRLILLDPVCRTDFQYNDRCGLLKLLADGRIKLTLAETFAKFSTEDQLLTFMKAASSAGLIAPAMDTTHVEEWLNSIDALFSLLATSPVPEVMPIPCLWIKALRRPSHWRPAQEEWLRLIDSDRKVIDADHWQIVMDHPYALQTAAIINRWLDQTAAEDGDE